MKKVTIVSHLTPAEWKMSWNDKVIDDSKGNMHVYREMDCFWGHFTGQDDFTICHHKPDEVKSMSLGMYFTGHVESDPQGCKITGSFGRKRTTNLFLGLGAILCILSIIGSIANNDMEIMAVSSILLVILFVVYFSRPQSTQKILLEHMEKISFDDSFHNKKVTKSTKKKGKYPNMKSITSRDASAIPKKGAGQARAADPETAEKESAPLTDTMDTMDTANTDATDTDTAGTSDTFDISDAVGGVIAGAANADPADTDPADADPVDADPADTDPAKTDAADMDTAVTESAQSDAAVVQTDTLASGSES